MSSPPLNKVNSHMDEITCHNPPSYHEISASPIWTISLAQSDNPEFDDQSLPPAYHTLTNVPLPPLNVPLPAPQFNSPPTTEPLYTEIPRHNYTNPSPPQPAIYSQQWNTETPAPGYNNRSTTPSSAYDDSFQDLRNPTTQRTTLSVIEQKFRKRKINIFGSVMILAALGQLVVSLSLQYDASKSLQYGIPYWTSSVYIVTGFLLIAVKRNPTVRLVWSSVVSNIITLIFCCTAMACFFLDIQKSSEPCIHDYCPYTVAFINYYILIAVNTPVLMISILAGLTGICALTSQSKEDS
ncbi:uncharacterized protein [Dendropsophus ebraccatus]|uniref:uncharacterized protein n=1 Tax=Dendropsophus ebraccatus TaxID=150705 RepID=UPI0038314E09